MYQNFLDQFTDFVFVEHAPAASDIIFIPGNGYPQMAERAAALWREGMAPLILPSGRFSTLTGHFSGVQARQELYPGPYETEWAFLRDVLLKNGVQDSSILREDTATYTYENAIQSESSRIPWGSPSAGRSSAVMPGMPDAACCITSCCFRRRKFWYVLPTQASTGKTGTRPGWHRPGSWRTGTLRRPVSPDSAGNIKFLKR